MGFTFIPVILSLWNVCTIYHLEEQVLKIEKNNQKILMCCHSFLREMLKSYLLLFLSDPSWFLMIQLSLKYNEIKTQLENDDGHIRQMKVIQPLDGRLACSEPS